MIYIIKASGTDAVKIGYTKRDIQKRLTALQVANPCRLELDSLYVGSRVHEKILHGHLGGYKVSGEWFQDSVEFRVKLADVIKMFKLKRASNIQTGSRMTDAQKRTNREFSHPDAKAFLLSYFCQSRGFSQSEIESLSLEKRKFSISSMTWFEAEKRLFYYGPDFDGPQKVIFCNKISKAESAESALEWLRLNAPHSSDVDHYEKCIREYNEWLG